MPPIKVGHIPDSKMHPDFRDTKCEKCRSEWTEYGNTLQYASLFTISFLPFKIYLKYFIILQ